MGQDFLDTQFHTTGCPMEDLCIVSLALVYLLHIGLRILLYVQEVLTNYIVTWYVKRVKNSWTHRPTTGVLWMIYAWFSLN